MQNRYAGDIGDFSKLGLLRQLSQCGITIGVNWYLTPDEKHNDDGRHIDYLQGDYAHKDDYQKCDETLWHTLGKIANSGHRTVSALEEAHLLPVTNTCYFRDELSFIGTSKQKRKSTREEWHAKALDTLRGCEIIFVDPDNGLIVPSAEGTKKSNKFVLPSELEDYYRRGASVIYYQHKARRQDTFYADQHDQLLSTGTFENATGYALKFVKTSQRYYFFIMHPQHKEVVSSCIKYMLESPWRKHFENITEMLSHGERR